MFSNDTLGFDLPFEKHHAALHVSFPLPAPQQSRNGSLFPFAKRLWTLCVLKSGKDKMLWGKKGCPKNTSLLTKQRTTFTKNSEKPRSGSHFLFDL